MPIIVAPRPNLSACMWPNFLNPCGAPVCSSSQKYREPVAKPQERNKRFSFCGLYSKLNNNNSRGSGVRQQQRAYGIISGQRARRTAHYAWLRVGPTSQQGWRSVARVQDRTHRHDHLGPWTKNRACVLCKGSLVSCVIVWGVRSFSFFSPGNITYIQPKSNLPIYCWKPRRKNTSICHSFPRSHIEHHVLRVM